MKTLSEYLYESVGLSNNSIMYRLGKIRLAGMNPRDQKRKVEKYNIAGKHRRAGTIKFARDFFVHLPSQETEIIPRDQWDLNGLIGETEYQLMHSAYSEVIDNYIADNKRQHDVLAIFQCSGRKPYNTNPVWARYKKIFGEFADFACVSNSGIVPWEVCGLYPFRYDEWNVHAGQKNENITNLRHKYNIVDTCRLIKLVRALGYKHVIITIPNPLRESFIDFVIDNDIDGASTWCHKVIDDTLRNKILNSWSILKKIRGLAYARMGIMPETFEKFAETLADCYDGPEKEKILQIWKKYNVHLEQSRAARAARNVRESRDPISSSRVRVLSKLSPQKVMDKFYAHIKDNMNDNGHVDLGPNDMYYQSYYWTVLDVLLIGMGGNLVEDIDAAYKKLSDYISHSSKWEVINPGTGGFLYAYKPLCETDDVKISTCLAEAIEARICQEKFPTIRDL